VLVAAVIVLWEAYARFSGVDPFVLPGPTRVLVALWDFRDEAVGHTLPTLAETLVGFSASAVAAIAAALVMDRVRIVREAVYPLLVGSQTIPIVAIAPLVVIWFGFGLLPKVLVIVLVTFFPITVALIDGLAATPADATDLMRALGASDRQVLWKLRWPAALPSLFTGLRIAATYAVIGAVFGEYVGAVNGLGIWMQLSQNSFRTDLVFAAILIAAAISIGLFLAVTALEAVVIPWQRASRGVRRE
jgi:ABC-type nitrate/sulfonate/bicarbonate transport system permease component